MATESESTSPPNNGGQPQQTVLQFLGARKVASAMWMMRLYTLFLTVQYVIAGSAPAMLHYFHRILLANGVVCALRLHQRVPNFQFSRHHLALMMQEDSAHYLFYSMIFLTCAPMTIIILPVFIFALLHSCSYTRQVLDVVGPHSGRVIRRAINYVASNQMKLFRFVAMNEIMVLPMLIFQLFGGTPSIFAIFTYYKFLTLRYLSQRNPYSRQVFYELRMVLQQYAYTQSCPGFLKKVINKLVDVLTRLGPEPPIPPAANNAQ